ncbi:MAG TPA: patatin-like phospholipase family protein, partial [Ktedonobacteraceae bacterium]|nr:patatin-like phospholipase family protein [Ktedonobacteraceae bacterium]
ALVTGGGGVVGIAWEAGLLVGMAEAGVDVRNADLFLGTSAGSAVAAQLTSGISLDKLFQLQVDPALQSRELSAAIDFKQISADFTRIVQEGGTIAEKLRKIGALALATPTVTEAERRAVIVSRLPVQHWPQKRLAIVAINASSGERVVFERESGVSLIDAVAASCAVPCVWPPVSINGRRYIDGGSYSAANADLAVGCERVLILQPDVPPLIQESLETQVEQLRSGGAQVEIIMPDETLKAILASVGGNLLDPSARERAAHAGRAQGRKAAAGIISLWQ